MLLTKTTLLSFLILLITLSSKGQSDINSEQKKSYFKFSISYLSNAVYYGRKDSFTLPYIIPSLSYHDKSGLYLEGSLSYFASSGQSQIDAGSITAGYDFNSVNEKISGSVYASKYFTSSSSYSVHGEVKGGIGSSLYYKAGPVSINGGADVSFSTKTDIGLNLGLSHAFEFGDGSFAITPSALVNTGTQNFYEGYFTNRKYSAKRKRRQTTNPNATKVIVIKKNFSVLDYELLLPVNYDNAKWGLSFIPTYSVPVNGFKYSINNGLTYRTETLSNTFYFEVGGYIKF